MPVVTEPSAQDLEFKSMGTCDECGRPLAKQEILSGLCRQCDPPRPARTSARVRLRGKEARHG